MSIRNLKSFFRPRSVALLGASARSGSVGNVLARNLQGGGFGAALSFVHPKADVILGVRSVASVDALPEAPELAVVATPAPSVPGIVDRLGERGTRAVVIVTAGVATATTPEGEPLAPALGEAAGRHGVRLIGPNCLGVLAPPSRLNASFSHIGSAPGSLAFVAQSGAIVAAVQDWAAPRAVGFSHLVSLGDMLDVDFGDMLDYLANDPKTDAILLYVEGIRHARKFMSAARAAARVKPVVAVKGGRFEAGVKAAASHSGAAAGSDAVYDAAFRRSGILRVFTLEELFGAVETLAVAKRHRGSRLAIVTNGGGLGVLAADALVEAEGRLAELSTETFQALTGILPRAWSGGNPVDVQGDASGGRYEAALRVILEDAGVDAVLVINCPTSMADRVDAARSLANVMVARRGKTLLASWVGAATTAEAVRVLHEAGVPSYDTPERAINAFMQLVEHGVRQDMLLQTPPSLPEDFDPRREDASDVLEGVLADGREWLSRPELARVLEAYGIPVGGPAAGRPEVPDLMVGMREDPQFGPTLLFGQGGRSREVMDDVALGFPPLNLRLAHALMARTRIDRELEGCLEGASAACDAVALTLVKVSQLVVDLPAVAELELDPFMVGAEGVLVLDGRVRVRPAAAAPSPRLAIRPYPRELEEDVELADGRKLFVRPVLPEDEPGLQRTFEALTPEEVRYRFFVPRMKFSHVATARFTQIDYDREMVFVLTEHGIPGETPIHGIVQISADPDNEVAEFAILVSRELRGLGLGVHLTRRIVDYARARGTRRVIADTLADNAAMLKLARILGFERKSVGGEPGVVRLELKL